MVVCEDIEIIPCLSLTVIDCYADVFIHTLSQNSRKIRNMYSVTARRTTLRNTTKSTILHPSRSCKVSGVVSQIPTTL
jgi:hypothetical protein